jgi:probable HAF family extracellular repeat protein
MHAFLWDAGVFTDLGTLRGARSVAYAVNNLGQVVGEAQIADGSLRAFIWSDGIMNSLGTLGGAVSKANDINDFGVIVGESQTAAGSTHAFVFRDGTLSDLDQQIPANAPWDLTRAAAINQAGQIVGSGRIQARTHAFMFYNGNVTDLGTLPGGTFSFAYDINEAGDIVGRSETSRPDVSHAFLYTQGVMIYLNDLMPTGSRWELLAAYGINDRGQIVGTGALDGQARAFRLRVALDADRDGRADIPDQPDAIPPLPNTAPPAPPQEPAPPDVQEPSDSAPDSAAPPRRSGGRGACGIGMIAGGPFIALGLAGLSRQRRRDRVGAPHV